MLKRWKGCFRSFHRNFNQLPLWLSTNLVTVAKFITPVAPAKLIPCIQLHSPILSFERNWFAEAKTMTVCFRLLSMSFSPSNLRKKVMLQGWKREISGLQSQCLQKHLQKEMNWYELIEFSDRETKSRRDANICLAARARWYHMTQAQCGTHTTAHISIVAYLNYICIKLPENDSHESTVSSFPQLKLPSPRPLEGTIFGPATEQTSLLTNMEGILMESPQPSSATTCGCVALCLRGKECRSRDFQNR